MTAEELLQRYAAGERDFSGISLESKWGLEGAELPDINLSGATLRRVDFDGADLSRANLSNANLGGANLESANLTEANLRNAIISDGILGSTNLSYADLSYANLTMAGLADADLTGAIMVGTIIGGEPLLVRANLTDVDLSQARIVLDDWMNNPRLDGAILNNTTMPDGSTVTFD
jgi:uncharacterized protein YjbI with pentapeptide repeats